MYPQSMFLAKTRIFFTIFHWKICIFSAVIIAIYCMGVFCNGKRWLYPDMYFCKRIIAHILMDILHCCIREDCCMSLMSYHPLIFKLRITSCITVINLIMVHGAII